MRPVVITFALALLLAGCGLNREPAPSGEPIELAHYTLECSSGSGWVEGSLRADVSIHDPLLGGTSPALTAIDVRRIDAAEPDPSGWLVRVVPVTWPSDYTGVRLASGEVAVVDATGNVVAMTGRDYRLGGLMVMVGAVGGSLFGQSWFAEFMACGSNVATAIPAT